MNTETTDQRILLGNEAIGRGLVEAGCQFISGYPGTPSSEILPAVVALKEQFGLPIYAEWSTNEKVALETALAAAYAGKRTAVVMKQVGLNVAADPAMSAAYVGVAGGLLLIVADDPGLHSSQTEQDSRFFAMFAKIPALDPSSPQEAKDLVGHAFALSEKYQIPILLRPTVRVCHSEQLIECKAVKVPGRTAAFQKNPRRWAAAPAARLQLHKELNCKLVDIEKEFESWPGNRMQIPPLLEGGKKAPLGIIAAGICHAHLHDLLTELDLIDRIPVLKIVTAYPLPQGLVKGFADRCERLLVFEENDATVELQVRLPMPVWGRLSGHVQNHGELTPDLMEKNLRGALADAGIPVRSGTSCAIAETVASMNLPVRRPTFCPGCGHRTTFYALRRAFPDALFPGDIGCYTMGLNQGAVDTVHDMGASITMASGFYHSYAQDGLQPPIFATIGDGTFFHSGPAGLENAMHNGARFVLLVLDNRTTAMTGHQPTAQAGQTADGHPGRAVDLDTLIRGCGIDYLVHADPDDLQGFQRILLDALDHTRDPDGGIAVVVTDYPCVAEVKGLGDNRSPQPVEVVRGPRPKSADCLVPSHRDQVSPCSQACPAGNDIEHLMVLAAEGRWDEAARMLYMEHPFPSTLGRVCPHPCESACNRNAYDGALAINSLERLAGDRGRSAADFVAADAANGKRVAVVGAGPSGLAAAYQLARRGYAVEVFEARSEVGGMLRWAIPEYRLPSAVLQRELEVFAKLGVTLRTGRRLGESLQWQELDQFDAVFLATGAWKQRPLDVDGVQREGVMSGLSYLEQERAGRAPVLGRRVCVIGGGNTAIDAARTARRKGAVVDVYYDVLLAIPEEVTAARDEGIVFHHQVVPASFAEGAANRVELRLRELTTGCDVDSTEADTVLVCVGGVADLGNLDEAQQGLVKDGRLAIDAWGRTSDRRIFAGGDASSAGTGTVVGAINSGKRAAIAIHEMLSGATLDIEASGLAGGPGIVGPEGIRLQFFRKVPRAKVQHRAPDDSVWNFEEVNLGLGTTQAMHEARERCFHCGVCTHCDICVDVCPTGAIDKFDGSYRINAEKCTGCRVCAAECPRGAIEMPATGFCIACGYCTTWFECPSLLKGSDGIVYIDRRTCIDCGICIQVCAQGAIRPIASEMAQ